MTKNKFRALFQSGEFRAGMLCFTGIETIVDLMGIAEFDFMIFDTEHVSYDVGRIERLVRAAEAAGIASIVRIHSADPYLIARCLDTGTDGVMFSSVASAAEAAEIVRMCRLAPDGTRSACLGSRSGDYLLMDRAEYTRRANDAAIVFMIESKEALDEIEGILAVPGLDGVVVGRSDLSYSLGVERNDPLVTQAQHRIAKVARAAGVGLMNIIYSPEELGPWLEMPEGPRVFWYATDTFQIGTWFQSLVRHSREIVASHGASRTPEA